MLVGDDPMRVTLANYTEDGFAVEVGGARTGACLDVLGEAAGGDVVLSAEWAGHIVSAMNI